MILLILGISAVLSQITPLAVGYLTDQVLAEQTVRFAAIIPILLGILVVNVVNEVVKVIRRLIVEDGHLNRSLEGTVKLIKLVFMDFAPAVATGIAAIVMIFMQLPAQVALVIILVIPIGTAIVLR